MRKSFQGIKLFVFLSLALTLQAAAQPWTYDFGTGTGSYNTASGVNTSFFTSTPSGGGTYRIRCGTTPGTGFVLANPGTSLGTGTELQINNATGTNPNKLTVYGWGSATTLSYLKLKLRTTSTGNGVVAIILGDGGTNAFQDAIDYSTSACYNASLALLEITYSGGAISTVKNRISGSFNTIASSGITKDGDQLIEIYGNNAATCTAYGKSGNNKLNAQSWDLWVDGTKISPAGGFAVAGTLAAGTNLNGFGLFAQGSTGNAANTYVDDLDYSNSLPTTTAPLLTTTCPLTLAFGSSTLGVATASQTFNLSGTNLTGSPGNITATASNTDFQVSSDNSTWGPTATIPYASATLTATPVYVRFVAQATGARTGTVTFSGGGVTTAIPVVDLTGTGTILANGDFLSSQTGNWGTASTWIKGLSGTSVTFTNASTAVTGVSTNFLTQLAVNDVLVLQTSSSTVRGTVQSITDNTHLVLAVAASATASGPYGKQVSPTSADGTIAIVNGHTVSVAADVTVDEMTIYAGSQVTINATKTLTLANASGIDINVNGNLVIDGTLTMNASTDLLESITGTITISSAGNLTANAVGTSAFLDISGALNASGTITTGRASGGDILILRSGSNTLLSGSAVWNIAQHANALVTLATGATLEIGANAVINGIGDFVSETGSTIRIASADGIAASGTNTGNIQNTGGTRTFTTGGNYTYNGTVAQVTGGGLPTTAITGTIRISNTTGVTPSNDIIVDGAGILVISGYLTPTSGQVMSGTGTLTGSGTAKVTRTGSGAFLNQYTHTTKTLTSLTIEYAGASSQTIGANTFGGIKINNAGGVSLDAAVTVNNTLTLTNGILTTTGSNLLTLIAGATTSASSNSAFVNGPVKKAFSAAETFIFPIGATGTGDEPLTVGGATAGDDFTAEYKRSSAAAIDPDVNSPIHHVGACDYWTLAKNSGGATSVSVTLSWDVSSPCNGTPYINNLSSLTVAHYNSGASYWEEAGTGGPSTTGNTTAGTVTRTGVSVFSPFTIAGTTAGQNPLPVKFGSIRGYAKNNGIQVDWTVYTEDNVDHYEVERAADGRQFQTVGSVISRNSTIQTDYHFFDAAPLLRDNFYRIKNVDIDGKFSYSNIIRVSPASQVNILSIYPNPVQNGSLNFQTPDPGRGIYNVKVINNNGQVIYTREFNHAGGDLSQAIQLPSGIKGGLYYLRLESETSNFQKVFVVQ
ncbi:MAG TPA: T9SS type A sorting domain-containing protein [Chitinophagaceae bacterium]|nr:T9SS type A sorting domain-containing protein [Chitinophagaceae bacterium]